MSQALYRKYRSKRLSEIVGQDHVTSLLERAIATNKTAHAYLLTGPRGTGKTSVARILAHEINQLPYTDESDHLDIIEIDAASNNGVDDVRELRDKALIAPAQAAKKIYIIDEVHMLSKPAFNALLKVIEEPPAHVVFILATTDVDKVPATIISRTQRYHFRLIDEPTVADHLAYIAKKEGINIEPAALTLIAERGGGSFRDSISLLDQLQHIAATDTITREAIETALGLATHAEIDTLGQALHANHAPAIITALQAIEQRGISAATIASQLRRWIRPQLANHPQLAQYLDGLVRVAKSHHPDILLLVTVLQQAVTPSAANQPVQATSTPHAKTPSKTVAASATTLRTTLAKAPISEPIAASPTAAPPAATSAKTTPAPKKITKNTAKSPSKPASEPPTPTSPSTPADPDKFDWEAITAYAAEHKGEFIGLASLLAKCTPELAGTTLTLYTGNKFNKNKLDSSKNRAILGKILAETGAGGLDIETLATAPPPKDAQAAKVAAIMGGGEEVDV